MCVCVCVFFLLVFFVRVRRELGVVKGGVKQKGGEGTVAPTISRKSFDAAA